MQKVKKLTVWFTPHLPKQHEDRFEFYRMLTYNTIKSPGIVKVFGEVLRATLN